MYSVVILLILYISVRLNVFASYFANAVKRMIDRYLANALPHVCTTVVNQFLFYALNTTNEILSNKNSVSCEEICLDCLKIGLIIPTQKKVILVST